MSNRNLEIAKHEFRYLINENNGKFLPWFMYIIKWNFLKLMNC